MAEPTTITKQAPTEANARALLDALGPAPAVVADRLAGLGVTGACYSPRLCPIANYLFERLDVTRVMVSQEAIALHPAGGGEVVALFTPRPVRRFIEGFDDGQFPKVEAAEVIES